MTKARAGTHEARILIADDDPGIRLVLREALSDAGFAVVTAVDGHDLLERVEQEDGDLVITDVLMPGLDGLDVMARIRERRPDLPVIVISAHATLSTAVDATRGGAFDYLAKPFDLDELMALVHRALKDRRSAGGRGGRVREAVLSGLGHGDGSGASNRVALVGRSAAMQTLYRSLARLVETDLTVMIVGESGTGKELIARLLHDLGPRRDGPFIAINMAAIPSSLIESELFGHEKGAFTGADRRKTGRFEQAAGGTLFLDEIGDMPLDAQTRLLRVLEEGGFTRVGGRETVPADARIVAATHQDLEALVARGEFRADLYYRLNVVPLAIPPLRARREDIPALARHFLAEAAREGLPTKTIERSAMNRLKAHDWPGNVRELRNIVRRLAALSQGQRILADDVEAALARPLDRARSEAFERMRTKAHGDTRTTSDAPGGGSFVPEEGAGGLEAAIRYHLERYFAAHGDDLPAGGLYERVLHEMERPLLDIAMRAVGHNQLRAAELLGINRNTLRKKLASLGLRSPRRRRSSSR
ncbi:MAG: nitrogen regulation protein NR(I) [Alphaproteobacteria bacterium]|nr:MAG: nitrogen regulation protein NR(I) [Alphaproteobacteria bacterium]